jgi:hypothetical protein
MTEDTNVAHLFKSIYGYNRLDMLKFTFISYSIVKDIARTKLNQ